MSESVAHLFVDRVEIVDGFNDMIGGISTKQIMMVEAAGGMGKSWLIGKLKHECSRRTPRITYADIDFKDPRLRKFLAVIRRARDDLGAAHFNHTTKVINRATQYNININISPAVDQPLDADFGDIADSEVNIAGGHVIKDNFFDLHAPSGGLREEIEAQISDAFKFDLKAFLSDQPAVIFFDTYDKAPQSVRSWIEAQLLNQIREGALFRAIVVVAGRVIPEVDISWKHCTIRPKLEALSRDDVRLLVRGKCGLSDDPDTLYRASRRGNPQLLGMLLDNIIDEDW
jgi:hypothetical protein